MVAFASHVLGHFFYQLAWVRAFPAGQACARSMSPLVALCVFRFVSACVILLQFHVRGCGVGIPVEGDPTVLWS